MKHFLYKILLTKMNVLKPKEEFKKKQQKERIQQFIREP